MSQARRGGGGKYFFGQMPYQPILTKQKLKLFIAIMEKGSRGLQKSQKGGLSFSSAEKKYNIDT
ncbi:MAG: hypothetical protein CRN43_13130 [Candidatus Nephrothrix sp. EaCA]|nr:MAG: hypothetical protein CRN43_13130 [Candidatus Nephrothrix sp. EaCA]